MDNKIVICGDANPKGNVHLTAKGGCGKELPIEEAYRCTGCGVFFHRDCIFEHFEREKDHSIAHHALKRIRDFCRGKKFVTTEVLLDYVDSGLDRSMHKPTKLI